MDVVLLHNPKAGEKSLGAGRLLALLRREGFRPRYCTLADAMDNPKLLDAGEFVVVAGGDGSVRRAALLLAGSDRRVAPIPTGTANNIALSLGVTGTIEDIIAGLAEPEEVRVDLGSVTGPWGERLFIEGIGFGLITRATQIIEEIDQVRAHSFSDKRERLHRNIAVVAALAREVQPVPLTVTLDQEERSDEFLLCEVLNMPRVGPGLNLAASGDPGDGRLDFVYAAAGERDLVNEVLARELGARTDGAGLPCSLVSTVRFRAPAASVRIDDEIVSFPSGPEGFAQIDIKLDPRGLRFLVPGRAL